MLPEVASAMPHDLLDQSQSSSSGYLILAVHRSVQAVLTISWLNHFLLSFSV
jgi:hypothetical protein